MDKKLFGFTIGDDIQVDIINKRLVRVSSENSDRVFNFTAVTLKETMMRLLIYLLIHGNDRVVSKDEILVKVWDENNLTSSNQRLWQMVNELQGKLCCIGITKDFIVNVRGVGYKVNHPSVKALYYYMS